MFNYFIIFQNIFYNLLVILFTIFIQKIAFSLVLTKNYKITLISITIIVEINSYKGKNK